ncbi:hypothetical protein D3C73_815800 [compost metagenome]
MMLTKWVRSAVRQNYLLVREPQESVAYIYFTAYAEAGKDLLLEKVGKVLSL